jgi:hypothetical protein
MTLAKQLRAFGFGLSTALAIGGNALAQNMPEGFTCCNLRYETGSDWISDSNYFTNNVMPVGSPAKVTGYGRYRAAVTINGKPYRLGNDYSRTLNNETFAAKWIVSEDPKAKIATFPKQIQDAIKDMKVSKGMTREQVFMSLGHPITSENPNPNAALLRYWLGSFEEFHLMFEGDRVKDIIGTPVVLNRVEHK